MSEARPKAKVIYWFRSKEVWRKYSQATINHIHLDNKLRIAGLERAIERIAELTLQVETAERARYAARDAIRNHEADAHGGQLAEAESAG